MYGRWARDFDSSVSTPHPNAINKAEALSERNRDSQWIEMRSKERALNAAEDDDEIVAENVRNDEAPFFSFTFFRCL